MLDGWLLEVCLGSQGQPGPVSLSHWWVGRRWLLSHPDKVNLPSNTQTAPGTEGQAKQAHYAPPVPGMKKELNGVDWELGVPGAE